jgi:HTH-type transcriptional regulator/antitoxin HipB
MIRKTVTLGDWIAERMERDDDFRARMEKRALGLLMEQLRLEQGMSQEELADRLNTKQSAISRIETGQEIPTLDWLRKAAGVLGAEVEILLRAAETSEAAVEAAAEQPPELSEAIDGIGRMYAELLRQVGVDSVTDLAEEDAGALREKLLREKKVLRVKRVPRSETLGRWIQQARVSSPTIGVGV